MNFDTIKQQLTDAWGSLSQGLLYTPTEEKVRNAVKAFLSAEPEWARHAIERDPALMDKTESDALEELLTYQGLHAIALHHEAHELYNKSEYALARKLSQGARRVTGGIEIHPGAKIGKDFFIDHGSGVVIGETAEVGDNVFLYHTVTLGASGNPKDIDTSDPENPKRRHPKLGSNIKIGNGAQLLGPITVDDDVQIGSGAKIIGKVHIGKGAKIAPGVEVRKDIPAGARVVGIVPLIPGVIDDKEGAWLPITRTKATETPGTMVADPEWLQHLSQGFNNLSVVAQRG